ncbi:YpsA SLOG family protein [Marinobacterium aestuariivivens]|uniref:YpsA SLOG family protein n=1 Tax=Marinobacterium aestuariivivens TaxID=1698799 RepID=A0ABW2A252_9GAMM
MTAIQHRYHPMLEKIISGGQTGADRAALDAALEAGFPAGGCCPVGRKAEDGTIDARYPLQEIGGGYRARTRRNVEDADGTAIFYSSTPSGGTELTLLFCIKTGKPYKLIDIDLVTPERAAQLLAVFAGGAGIATLNVAGPRHSGCPAVYAFVKDSVSRLIAAGDHRQG